MTRRCGRRLRLAIRRSGYGMSSIIRHSGRWTTICHSGRAIAMSNKKKTGKLYKKKGLQQRKTQTNSTESSAEVGGIALSPKITPWTHLIMAYLQRKVGKEIFWRSKNRCVFHFDFSPLYLVKSFLALMIWWLPYSPKVLNKRRQSLPLPQFKGVQYSCWMEDRDWYG